MGWGEDLCFLTNYQGLWPKEPQSSWSCKAMARGEYKPISTGKTASPLIMQLLFALQSKRPSCRTVSMCVSACTDLLSPESLGKYIPSAKYLLITVGSERRISYHYSERRDNCMKSSNSFGMFKSRFQTTKSSYSSPWFIAEWMVGTQSQQPVLRRSSDC